MEDTVARCLEIRCKSGEVGRLESLEDLSGLCGMEQRLLVVFCCWWCILSKRIEHLRDVVRLPVRAPSERNQIPKREFWGVDVTHQATTQGIFEA
eukprot:3842091-Amphidinium_carterae.1